MKWLLTLSEVAELSHAGAVQTVLVTLPPVSANDTPLEVAMTASSVAPRSPCRRLSLLPLGVLHNCTPFDLMIITQQVCR